MRDVNAAAHALAGMGLEHGGGKWYEAPVGAVGTAFDLNVAKKGLRRAGGFEHVRNVKAGEGGRCRQSEHKLHRGLAAARAGGKGDAAWIAVDDGHGVRQPAAQRLGVPAHGHRNGPACEQQQVVDGFGWWRVATCQCAEAEQQCG